MNEERLDQARQATLDEARRSKARARGFVLAGGVLEGVLLLAIFLVIDLRNPTHLLIFFCACLAYGPLALGLFALRNYMDVTTQRVLKGIQAGHGDNA